MTLTSIYICMCLAVTGTAALIHINRMNRRSWLECAGFAMVIAGSFGALVEYLWPFMQEHLGVGQPTRSTYGRLFFLGGIALVALKLGCADLYRMLHPMTFHRDVLEAASVAETKDDFVHVRMAAAAALAQDGIERRGISECTSGLQEGFMEQRFQRTR